MSFQILILLDGHDEYELGTNQAIDNALTKQSLRNCYIVLTSRTTKQLAKLRKCMDYEVDIVGFDDETAVQYAKKFLQSNTKGKSLNEQFQKADNQRQAHFLKDESWRISSMLKIPILLQMICCLMSEDEDYSLPHTKGAIIDGILQFSIQRALQKSGNKLDIDVHQILLKLGKAAWMALTRSTRQLLLSWVCP